MKAIQKELGEDIDSQEANDLRERIEALELPEEARQEVDRELRRLERIPRESAEAQVVRTYLEIVADLPWSETTEEQLDIARAEEILERDHYGLRDVKDRVLDFLAVRKLQEETRLREAAEAEADGGGDAATDEEEGTEASGNGDAEGEAEAEAPEGSDGEESDEAGTDSVPGYDDDRAGETLLFVGPPGVGKTSIARSIADAMGRKYVRVSLGGARDEADIRGHRRTYVGAMAGRIIEGLKRAGTKNPVFLLDEIDKLGVSFQGDPSAALMEVLDPAQNEAFVDHYLGVPFDLSEVLFIATANVFQQIPGPLRDRMEAIEFRGYTEAEKLEIARRFLLPRQKRRNGLLPEQVEVDEGAIRAIITRYTREAGVRQLERELGSVCRKSARKIATGSSEAAVGADDLRELLGRPKVHAAEKMEEDSVGVATGMFYTPVGGDIMLVETRVLKGKEGLVLTGQLGDVMKESAQAALTFARSHANGLDLTEERLRDHEIHIHVPAGAIPKEGPSAGIAMAVALVSALGDHPVRHDVAMTGEITLSGRVLPIGGVKEKVLGAARAGINEIILPAINEGDLEDLPDHVCEQLEFHLVETLDEALAAALANGSLEEGTLAFSDSGEESSG
ncbi:MAG: endopeptidase La [Gemmatimonadota bacterium]|nr:endopeptidase La [Candidatus Palauibacter soopunensis]